MFTQPQSSLKMKSIVALLVLVALASASPMTGRSKAARSYVPEENNPNRSRYLYFQDEQGGLHFEDLSRAPERRATEDDVKLYLHARNEIDGVPIRVDALVDLFNTSVYDPKKDNYFLMHGWNNDHSSSVNTLLKNAILQKSDSNVFVVDWGKIANKNYVTSRAAVRHIGEFVGDFINSMLDHYQISPKKFKLIGHSLGAHVAGCVGARVNGLVDYISGLDPASPLFTLSNIGDRLDETDAEFVQVIHTSTTLLGFASSIGHADYFPNGGSKQPGCGLDITGACAHSRAYEYYEESILSGGFAGPECESYDSFQNGNCNGNLQSHMGSIYVDKSAGGDYYLHTNKKTPFSKI